MAISIYEVRNGHASWYICVNQPMPKGGASIGMSHLITQTKFHMRMPAQNHRTAQNYTIQNEDPCFYTITNPKQLNGLSSNHAQVLTVESQSAAHHQQMDGKGTVQIGSSKWQTQVFYHQTCNLYRKPTFTVC